MQTLIQCLKTARKGITSRRHLRLVRGTFNRRTSHMSVELRDSALREFARIAKPHGSFEKY